MNNILSIFGLLRPFGWDWPLLPALFNQIESNAINCAISINDLYEHKEQKE